MILSSIKCVAPNCDWVIVYCTLSTPEISAQLGPLPISTTCAGALSDSGKMSKQRTLLNLFKPSSSSSSQENDSEGTTAASEGTSGGPSSESRKRKQAPVPDGGDTQIKKSVTSATGKSFRKEWLKEYSWLEEIRTKEGVVMKCKTCVHANAINTFTKGAVISRNRH